MSKAIPEISPELAAWIAEQHLFIVATAPTVASGHLNCSPKGGDSFRVLDPHTVAYLDYTGSGAETIAHLKDNGRIVVMFSAFDGAPRIVRLHGRGEVLESSHPEFPALLQLFALNVGARSIIRIAVDRVSNSCGYAVPLYDFNGFRDNLDKWAESKGAEGLEAYRRTKNQKSIDGLPALEIP